MTSRRAFLGALPLLPLIKVYDDRNEHVGFTDVQTCFFLIPVGVTEFEIAVAAFNPEHTVLTGSVNRSFRDVGWDAYQEPSDPIFYRFVPNPPHSIRVVFAKPTTEPLETCFVLMESESFNVTRDELSAMREVATVKAAAADISVAAVWGALHA